MATIPIVDTVDKRKGMIASATAMVLIIIMLFLIKFELADPPPKDIELATQTEWPPELNFEELIMESGGMSGNPSDNPVDKPQPQTEKVLTKETNPDTKEVTGESNQSNTSQSDNPPSTTQQSNNPFGGGGENNGPGPGKDGDVLGQNNGPGPDKGPSHSNVKRVLMKNPKIQGLQQNIDTYIYLKVTIDNRGNIVYAENIKGKTTTSSQTLINKVKAFIIKNWKYNTAPNAPLTTVALPRIKIDAQ